MLAPTSSKVKRLTLLVPLVMHSPLALAITSLGLMAIGIVAWVWVKPRLPQGSD
jgi:DHA1 family bicyclomycin/chloramphenicol resistance-like MFS transporter